MIRGIKWLLALLLTVITAWVMIKGPVWGSDSSRLIVLGLLLLSCVASMIEWRHRWALLTALALIVIVLLSVPDDLHGRTFVIVNFILLNSFLFILRLILANHDRAGLFNLITSLFSLAFTLVVIELFAPAATDFIAQAQRQAAIQAAQAEATAPLQSDEIIGQSLQSQTQNRSPQFEFIEQGPGPAWGMLTGWGTNTDTTLHYWMDGVYDVRVVYNSLGFRGPDIPYEKPDDIYRIMLLGDSFIEAREVAYEDTVYAQLGELLADATTPDGKRFEVFGVGAVGWGTIQAYLYYHHEGYKFAPDLVIHNFYINDVSDNNPAVFYPDRNYDFLITENSMSYVDYHVGSDVPAAAPITRILEALPRSNTSELIARVFDPPPQMITLAGNLGMTHPQNYIYVREPEIAGYPEGWERTAAAYRIWANELAANNTRFMVVSIDISAERITEVTGYFKEQQDGWVWDIDLATNRLASILEPLGVHLIRTREHYAAYARSSGILPFDALFYVEDGHWNPQGHKATAILLDDVLREQGIVVIR